MDPILAQGQGQRFAQTCAVKSAQTDGDGRRRTKTVRPRQTETGRRRLAGDRVLVLSPVVGCAWRRERP